MPAIVAIEALALGIPPQGIGSYCLQLVGALAAAPGDFEYRVFLPREGLPWFEHLESPRMRLIPCPVPGGRAGRVAWQHLVFPSRLREYGRPLLHSLANLLPWRWRGPAVLTVHDLDFLLHPADSSAARRALFGLLTPSSLRRAGTVIAVSQFTADTIRERYPLLPVGRIRIIPHGAPPARTVSDEARADVLDRHGLREPYLLSVGTLEPRKGILQVIAAYETYRSGGGSIRRLVLAGRPGRDAALIAGAIARSPFRREITVTGYVQAADLPALYRGAWCLLFLSEAEGFGLPALEAQALGCPVIATRAGALPETCGAGALLVPPRDAAAAAAALDRLDGDDALRRALVEAGLGNLARFSWQEHASKLQDVYREILEKSPSHP